VTRNAVRLVTAAFVLGTAALGFVPLPASASDAPLTARTEGWYQPDPSCKQATGCLLANVPPAVSGMVVTNPYPAGTLHVGWAGGQETARSVLAFPVDGVAGTLIAAVLDVPLDVSATDGSAQPETAKVQVCLVTGDIVAAQGSVATPPSTSCTEHALLTYVATPAPHLTGSLAALLPGLPTTSGIALLPDASAAQTDAWHVTFSAHDRTPATTGPARLTVTTSTGQVVDEPLLPPVAAPPAAAVTGGLAAAPTGVGSGPALAAPPAVTAPVVMAPVSPELAAPVTGAASVPVARTVTIGYAYPVVWLLPLGLLMVVPMVARALTRDLTRA
jgi:hypothetical protein